MAVVVSRGSHNSVVQVMTLVMASVVSEVAVRLFFRDEAVYKLTRNGAGRINLSEIQQAHEPGFSQRLKEHKLGDIQQLIQEVKRQGDVKVYVCSSSIALCGVREDDLIPEVDEIRGLTSFLLEEIADADKVLTF